MATLAITDRKDGTGVDVTIAGVVGTAKLYTAAYNGKISNNPFVVQITTAIDVNNQLVTLGVGPFSAILVDDNGPVSPVSFRVTDGSEGIHYRCLTALRDFVRDLSLPSFPTDATRYKIHNRPCDTFIELKESSGGDVHGVHFWRREEQPPRVGTNSEADVFYVIEMVLAKSNKLSNIPSADWTYDRERILRGIRDCPLESVPEVFFVRLVPGILFQSEKTAGVDTQSLQFHCEAYVPQGFV